MVGTHEIVQVAPSRLKILQAKILIVDDQAINVLLLERLLAAAGYQSVSSTHDPREVGELHRSTNFDLILLDVQMPGFDGFEVLNDLKLVETGGYLPVLMITAQPSHKVRALEAGARDFVSKPFDFAEVLVRVRNMIELRLLHAATRAAEQVAQAAIRARDEVLGIVAHDLRSPLNTMTTQLELIRRRSGHLEPLRAPVSRLEGAARQMDRLIHDLLDVAQLDAGQSLAMDLDCVDAQALIEAALEAKRERAEEAGLTLALESPSPGMTGMTPLWGDFVRLLQVFDNLLGNAIKFTRPGGTLVVGAVESPGEVVFSVTDSGAGISASHLPHLFDRFWQEDARDRRGAGLGLAIVKGIVEALGGRIWVESTLGIGTSFYFTVPFADPSVAPAREPRNRLEVPRDRFTILLAEDDDGARLALEELLQDEGYHVHSAPSGEATIDVFTAHAGAGSIDLLLTDLRLGAMNGFELALRIRTECAQRSMPVMPVVFMTGMLPPPELAGEACIRKPLDLGELLALLEHELALVEG